MYLEVIMLEDLLASNNKVFKLVCGAGNECAQDVERLTALYSKAGAQVFDICAKPEILEAAKLGLEKSGISENRYICVSVGMKGDPHISKALINPEVCNKCGMCTQVCPNDAIIDSEVLKEKCIGCSLCAGVCLNSAISMYECDRDLNTVLPELVKMGIDCIELHATSEADDDVWDKWEIINSCFDGVLSICIDRLNLGNKQVLDRVKKLISSRKPYSTIIQADGIPMSGSDDSYKTTLQAVAMAEIIQNEDLPVYILISGGTNSKTARLADICDIDYGGIAIGSYARKIVKQYIYDDDFYKDNVFSKALEIAQNLVNESV